jgi:nitrogen fixation NifU-like protein
MTVETERDVREVYTDTTIDHAMDPRNMEELEGADAKAVFTGPCGDTVVFWIKGSGGELEQVNFRSDGGGSSVASGSMITEMARGKTVGEALEIGQEEVLKALGGLPMDHEHCALLAVKGLEAALEVYTAERRESSG